MYVGIGPNYFLPSLILEMHQFGQMHHFPAQNDNFAKTHRPLVDVQ